jgi:hypothetical protein
MDTQTLVNDFKQRSGGFPPESDDQITVYLDCALPVGFDRQDAFEFLQAWYDSGEDVPPKTGEVA